MTDDVIEGRKKFFKDCQFVVKAPGSFFWTGEHSVMFGQPAIIQQIPLYVYVGIRMNESDRFQYEIKCISSEVSPLSQDLKTSHFEEITEKWEQEEEIDRVLEQWKEDVGFRGRFTLKIWSEIPPRVGLNSSGAMGACFSVLLGLLEEGLSVDEVKAVLSSWREKKVEELKRDCTFLDMFKRAWMFDDVFHDFSSSGAGPISSLLNTFDGKELILYFSEKKGYGSRHPLQRSGQSYTNHLSKVREINFCATRIGLHSEFKDDFGVCAVYSGIRKVGTGGVLRKVSRWHSIDIAQMANMISSLFELEKFEDFQVAEPLFDFLNREGQEVDCDKVPREAFSRCLGMVSWRMLLSILNGDLASFYHLVRDNHALLKYYGVFTTGLRKLKREIRDNIDEHVWIKLTGAGGGGDLIVFWEKNAIETIGNKVGNRLHFSTTVSGWGVDPVWIEQKVDRFEDTTKKEPRNSEAGKTKGDIVEMGIREESPYLMINGEQAPNLKEGVFCGMALLATAVKKRKRGEVDRNKELRLVGKEQQLSDIREFLEALRFKEGKARVVACGKGEVRLEIDSIIVKISRSICTFESSHRKYVENTIDLIHKRFKRQSLRDNRELTEDEKRQILNNLGIKDEEDAPIRKMKSMVRHTFLVKNAVEIMAWCFHDKKWENAWWELVKKCDEVMELIECDLTERSVIGFLDYRS